MDEKEIKFLAEEIQIKDPRMLSLIVVCGKSMSPFLKDGDELIVLSKACEDIKMGDIVICRCENKFLARRFFRKFKDTVNLRPDNSSTWLNVNKAAILGIVIERRRGKNRITRRNWYWVTYSYLVIFKHLIKGAIRRLRRFIR